MAGVIPGPAGPATWTSLRSLGRRGPTVTGLGLGGAPLGNLFAGVTDEDAQATVDAAWAAGIRYFDTAPLYGHGLSETRLGRALADRPRDQYVLSSKVGRLLRAPGSEGPAPTIFVGVDDLEPVVDFSAAGVHRSLEESLTRLGTDRLDLVLVHDPDDHEEQAVRDAFPALLRLRDEGVVRAVGCGMNQWEMPTRFVERFDLDCVLLAGRYTLLDRSGAERLLPLCAERGVGMILGGVFNSGVLADPDRGSTYDYLPAGEDVLARARVLGERCAARGVPLPAAALQFALRGAGVTTVLVGARSAAEIATDVEYATTPIPKGLWNALDAA